MKMRFELKSQSCRFEWNVLFPELATEDNDPTSLFTNDEFSSVNN